MTRLTCDVPVAGRVIGLGRNASYEAARVGEIPAIRFGKRLLVPVGALAEKLNQPVDAIVAAIEKDASPETPAGRV